jgi:hypothetical protein
MNLKSIIRKLDIFGTKIELELNGQSRSTTVMGGVLCIIVIVLIISATWVLGNDIFYRLQPSILIQNELKSQRPNLVLDKYTYPISIVMQGMEDNVPYFNEKYFSYSINLMIVNNTDSTIKTVPYEIEKCNYDHFPYLSQEQIDKAGIPRYYCIKDQNITLYGYWDETINAYLNIRLSYCIGDNCAPEEEIRNWFKNNRQMYTWNVYVQNSLVDSQNYETPITNYILNKYKLVNDGSHKLYELYLQKINVITDRGAVFEDHQTVSTYSYEYAELDTGPMGADKSLFDMNIYSSNNLVNFKRKYIKIQNIFANIGGLMQALLISAKIMTYYFSKIHKNTKLVNNILEFENSYHEELTPHVILKRISIVNREKSKLEFSAYKDSYIAFDNKNINIDNSPDPYTQNKKKKYVDTLFKEKKSRNLKFTFLEILTLIFCRYCIKSKRLKDKKALYDISMSPLSKRIDLVNIIKKIEEIDKLKFVLFNKEQLALFNFISKEKIVLDKKKQLSSTFPINSLYEYINDKDKLASVVVNYQYKDLNQLTHIDKQLVNLLDELFKIRDIKI